MPYPLLWVPFERVASTVRKKSLKFLPPGIVILEGVAKQRFPLRNRCGGTSRRYLGGRASRMPLQIGKSTNTSPDNDKQNDHNGEDHTNFWTAAAFFCLRCKSTGLIPLHRWCICESRLLIVVHSWWLGIAASLKPTCRKWRRRLRVKRLLGCRGSVSVEIVRF